MIELRDFHPGDLDRFEPGAFDRQALQRIPRALFRRWEGMALSAVEDDRVLGIGGVAIEGVYGHAWIFGSDRLREKYPVLLTKLALRGLDGLMRGHELQGVVVDVEPAFETSRLWLERLGFEAVNTEDNPIRYIRHGIPYCSRSRG